jgi:hypothetical protein
VDGQVQNCKASCQSSQLFELILAQQITTKEDNGDNRKGLLGFWQVVAIIIVTSIIVTSANIYLPGVIDVLQGIISDYNMYIPFVF